ncbi:radial spoke head protein 4a [Ptiloglossa arizonensis]|uniref:radial spoke head protein 4a n=1 Tax=Ptiloglossa arizonensis TaxID=3350558 RepID=UPI003F9F84E9
MAYSYNIEEVPPDDVPCMEHDLHRAKMFLQKYSPESGNSLYDHLTEVLAKILAERPKNVVDIFEEYSRKVKEERFKTQTDHLRDLYVPPSQYEDAKKFVKLFEVQRIDETERETLEEEDEDDKKKLDLMKLLFYFEQTNVGLPRTEMAMLNLSIRKLMAEAPIGNVKFWGKILGNPKNYYVVEADLTTEELNKRLEKLAEEELEEERKRQEELAKAETAAGVADETDALLERDDQEDRTEDAEGKEEKEKVGLKLVFPPLPTHSWKPATEVPAERIGSGLNSKVYFVCNKPGPDTWIELPSVTPQQILIARQIVRYCTGNLETPIHTYPPYPGTEKNYLRAQIARISATTQVSPIGFFTFEGENEEEELGEEPEEGVTLTENVHYDPLSVKNLVDPSMANWCHHVPYILKQGRTVWWNPVKEDEEEEVGEEEEALGDEEEKKNNDQREVGPPLLTPLSEDAIVDTIIPWTARQSSQVLPDLAVALLRSNIWPGAFAFACERRFANLYIGWGHKYNAFNYSPPTMPPVQDQYKLGPEIMETQDPTFEQEEAYRIAHLPPPPPLPMGEEEEEVVEEEEEEEEEEEDDE